VATRTLLGRIALRVLASLLLGSGLSFLAAAEKTDHTNCLGRPIKRIPDRRMAIFSKSYRLHQMIPGTVSPSNSSAKGARTAGTSFGKPELIAARTNFILPR
jgi:hypothetical protein